MNMEINRKTETRRNQICAADSSGEIYKFDWIGVPRHIKGGILLNFETTAVRTQAIYLSRYDMYNVSKKKWQSCICLQTFMHFKQLLFALYL